MAKKKNKKKGHKPKIKRLDKNEPIIFDEAEEVELAPKTPREKVIAHYQRNAQIVASQIEMLECEFRIWMERVEPMALECYINLHGRGKVQNFLTRFSRMDTDKLKPEQIFSYAGHAFSDIQNFFWNMHSSVKSTQVQRMIANYFTPIKGIMDSITVVMNSARLDTQLLRKSDDEVEQVVSSHRAEFENQSVLPAREVHCIHERFLPPSKLKSTISTLKAQYKKECAQKNISDTLIAFAETVAKECRKNEKSSLRTLEAIRKEHKSNLELVEMDCGVDHALEYPELGSFLLKSKAMVDYLESAHSVYSFIGELPYKAKARQFLYRNFDRAVLAYDGGDCEFDMTYLKDAPKLPGRILPIEMSYIVCGD